MSLVWVLVAQTQMGESFRIGVDNAHATALIRHGWFGVSRNPIFLGLLVMLLGCVLVLPSAASLAVSVLGYASIQIQVRLEEEHLTRLTAGRAALAVTRPSSGDPHTPRWARCSAAR